MEVAVEEALRLMGVAAVLAAEAVARLQVFEQFLEE